MDNWYGAYEIGRERGADILRFAEVERLVRRHRRNVNAHRLGLGVMLITLVQGAFPIRGAREEQRG